MPDSKPPPSPLSLKLGRMLLAATPQQREESLRIASKLLARRAARELESERTGQPVDLTKPTKD